MGAGRGYRFFNLGKHLVCLDQSVLSAVKNLGFGFRRNKLQSIGISWSVARAEIKTVIKDKLRLLDSSKVIELPVFGHIGMQVHCGCKVFDFGRQEVAKIFGPEVSSQDARSEIAACKHASRIVNRVQGGVRSMLLPSYVITFVPSTC